MAERKSFRSVAKIVNPARDARARANMRAVGEPDVWNRIADKLARGETAGGRKRQTLRNGTDLKPAVRAAGTC